MATYQTIILPAFRKELKPYIKKFRSLKDSIIDLLDNFNHAQHINLGNGIYKIRLKIKEIPKGKSKSFRLIVLIMEIEKYLVPITIYFKGDQEDITKKELNTKLEAVLSEK